MICISKSNTRTKTTEIFGHFSTITKFKYLPRFNFLTLYRYSPIFKFDINFLIL